MKKTVYFDHLRPYFLTTGENSENLEQLYDLSGLFRQISTRQPHEAKKKIFGDYHLFHKCTYDEQLKVWELQILHLRQQVLPGIADTDGSYELIELGEGQYPAESTTILYDQDRCTLYMQRNIFGTSIRVLSLFLQELAPEGTLVLLKPKLCGNRLNRIMPNKLYKRVVLVADMDQLEENHRDTSLGRLLHSFGRYQGKIVEIKLGFGRERNRLLNAEQTVALVKEAYAYNGTQTLKVQESGAEDISFETINLLDDRATYKTALNYKRENPITHNRLYYECLKLYKEEMGIE